MSASTAAKAQQHRGGTAAGKYHAQRYKSGGCMFKLAVVLVSASLFTSAAVAVNKCTGADGKISFQDAPCVGNGGAISVKPASGVGDPVPVVTGARAPVVQQYEALKGERIRREKWLVMNGARGAVDDARRVCDEQQKQLAASKAWSKNNLAGATRDSSISQEMTAAAVVCDSRVRSLERDVTAAEKVCDEIKCIPVF